MRAGLNKGAGSMCFGSGSWGPRGTVSLGGGLFGFIYRYIWQKGEALGFDGRKGDLEEKGTCNPSCLERKTNEILRELDRGDG